MAVYERSYRSYRGELTPPVSRFLVIPRYAYREVFQSKLFVGFLVACYVWPLVLAILIYLPHNLKFLEQIQAEARDILNFFFGYDETFFFRWFTVPYVFVAGILALIVGPALISKDLRNNGLPLYLARPFNRSDYILGKMSILVILLSAITWVPGLLLFLFQSYMAGWGWLRDHWRIGIALTVSFWIWILLLCLMSLAISAYVKWKPVARIALIGVFFVASALAGVINVSLRTHWGSLINVSDMFRVVASRMFGVPTGSDVPAWAAWLSLAAAGALCLLLLSRKVRAYEVVRS